MADESSRPPATTAAGSSEQSEATPSRKGQPSLETNAGILSIATFSWLTPLIHRGAKAPLQLRDLEDPITADTSDVLLGRFNRAWNTQVARAAATGRKPSFVRAFFAMFAGEIRETGVYQFLTLWLVFVNPVALQFLLAWLARSDGNSYEGFIYTFAILIAALVYAVVNNRYFAVSGRMGYRARNAVIAKIFQKAMSLTADARNQTTQGQMVNMMSTDSQRLIMFSLFIHQAWAAPLMISAAMFLLVDRVGVAAWYGVLVMVALAPVQLVIAVFVGISFQRVTKITDERVKATNELLQGIRIIKFYSWEYSFLDLIKEIRSREIGELRKIAWLRTFLALFIYSTPVLVSLVTFGYYAATGGELTADRIFPSIALFSILQFPLTILPLVLGILLQAFVSMRRLSTLFMLDEFRDDAAVVAPSSDTAPPADGDGAVPRLGPGVSTTGSVRSRRQLLRSGPAVSIADGEFRWATRRHITAADVKAKQRTAVKLQRAAVAAAKAAEKRGAKVGTSTQAKDEAEAKAKALDEQAKKAVEAAAAAAETLSIADQPLPPVLQDINVEVQHGELVAVVGPVGSGKSSLLAAMLGDMERSAASQVRRNGSTAFVAQTSWIFNATLRNNILFGKEYDAELYDATVAACALSQDLKILPSGDATEIGEKGINLSGGQKQRVSIARAMYADADIVIMDDALSAVDAHVGKHIFDKCVIAGLRGKTRVIATNQLQFLPQMDRIIVLESGRITHTGTFSELQAQGLDFHSLVEEEAGEDAAAAEVAPGNSKGSRTSTSSGRRRRRKGTATSATSASGRRGSGSRKRSRAASGSLAPAKDDAGPSSSATLVTEEERAVGAVKSAVVVRYLASMGAVFFAVIVTVSLITPGVRLAMDVWLTSWTDNVYPLSLRTYLLVYVAIGLTFAVVIFIRTAMYFMGGLRASLVLQQTLLERVIRAPTRFFDVTPTGRIINRFSKDLDKLDQQMAASLSGVVESFLTVAGIIALICVLLPPFIPVVLTMGYIYYRSQAYYRRTSRELKRLESVSSSPIYAHFSESLNGVATLRAYDRTKDYERRNRSLLDDNVSTAWPLFASSRWFALRLELIGGVNVTAVALIIVLLKIFADGWISPSFGGLAIAYALSVTQILGFTMRNVVELEQQLNSVERMKEYSEMEVEAPPVIAASRPAVDWPQHGLIEYRGVVMRYRPELPPVLKGINVVFKAGEKVGIVGRTGAGKSSLMVTLFRLTEPSEGKILIDGIDTSTLGLHDLRSRLSIIPQDPVVFSGTIRSNLDPFKQHDDTAVWAALEQVSLHALVQALDGKLDAKVTEEGSNLSVGQRQLLCIARALLRQSRILLLDEATSAVDFDTDAVIQKMMRTAFKDRTVLTIAHRLNTVIDSDRVLVMDAGRVAEFDTPQKLLADPNSLFSRMLADTGDNNARYLRQMAAGAAADAAEPVDFEDAATTQL